MPKAKADSGASYIYVYLNTHELCSSIMWAINGNYGIPGSVGRGGGGGGGGGTHYKGICKDVVCMYVNVCVCCVRVSCLRSYCAPTFLNKFCNTVTVMNLQSIQSRITRGFVLPSDWQHTN